MFEQRIVMNVLFSVKVSDFNSEVLVDFMFDRAVDIDNECSWTILSFESMIIGHVGVRSEIMQFADARRIIQIEYQMSSYI
jgi:hypothetical protein